MVFLNSYLLSSDDVKVRLVAEAFFTVAPVHQSVSFVDFFIGLIQELCGVDHRLHLFVLSLAQYMLFEAQPDKFSVSYAKLSSEIGLRCLISLLFPNCVHSLKPLFSSHFPSVSLELGACSFSASLAPS